MSSKPFLVTQSVEKSFYAPIYYRFQVLFDKNHTYQQTIADKLNIDKGFVSRIVRGLEIPGHKTRMEIAEFFGVDSSTIWRMEDLPYIEETQEKLKERLKDGRNEDD